MYIFLLTKKCSYFLESTLHSEGASASMKEEITKATKSLRAEMESMMDDMKQKFERRFNEIERENSLKMEAMKQDFNNQLNDLMTEIDDEKKTRLSTQVELDRIRKLHARH